LSRDMDNVCMASQSPKTGTIPLRIPVDRIFISQFREDLEWHSLHIEIGILEIGVHINA
jgi:hypothetical protein